jgi:hypothetical protein
VLYKGSYLSFTDLCLPAPEGGVFLFREGMKALRIGLFMTAGMKILFPGL